MPFTFTGTGSVRGGTLSIDASASSQFVSGLLLSAPRFDEGLHLTHVGERLPSMPHIDMTVAALRARGGQVDDEPGDRESEPDERTGVGDERGVRPTPDDECDEE